MTDFNAADFEKRDDVIRLAENFYFIEGPRGAKFPHCNCFLLTGDETVLIDTGIGPEKIKEIDELKHIDIVILSHTHIDHIWNWSLLENRKFLIPKQSPEAVKDLQLLGERFTGNYDDGAYWARSVKAMLNMKALREPDERFNDGDIIKYGGAELQAIHTPGHLVDHYCFFELKSQTLITTDIDLTSFGPVYIHEESDIDLFVQSIEKVMALPYKTVCTSHKLPIFGDATKLFEYYLQGFHRHGQKILEFCSLPRTLDEIVEASPIYQNSFPDRVIQKCFERQMIKKNLDKLVRDGLAEESGGRYKRVE